MLSRRTLLRCGSLLPMALVIGCAGQPVATVAAEVVNDIGLIGSGLAGAFPALQASGLVSAAALSSVNGYIGQIKQIAASVSTATTVAAGQTAVQSIETLLNATVSAVAGLPLPAPFGPALQAASVLLPFVETGVGLLVSSLKAPSTVPGAAAPTMTAADARLTLQLAARGVSITR